MPPAVALPAPEPGLERADFGLPDGKFVFYSGFDFRSYVGRKNPLAAIAAFRRAFPRGDMPVCLVLKTIGSGWKPEDRDALITAIPASWRSTASSPDLTRSRCWRCPIALCRCTARRGSAAALPRQCCSASR
jgi:hypothetical protein